MHETLNLIFRSRENGQYELQVRESWSGRTARGRFDSLYSPRELTSIQRKISKLNGMSYQEANERELRQIGSELYKVLCGPDVDIPSPSLSRRGFSDQPVRAMLRSAITSALSRRSTVALTFGFTPGCDDLVLYPWELLHNGELFLLASGVFTLTRAFLSSDKPVGNELPVQLPMHILYVSASPRGCVDLATEYSLKELERAFGEQIEDGEVVVDKLEQATYEDLVAHLDLIRGSSDPPSYVLHFDGHGAYGKLCPNEHCPQLNEPQKRACAKCGISLRGISAQTYLCFCDEQKNIRYIDTQSLRDLLMSSDIRLAVFSACETATLSCQVVRHHHQRIEFDSTLATSLVRAQMPAVVAMPFSVYDNLSPIFVYHFYHALAHRRTLEEALSRARQALLPHHQRQSWFIPVLYRHMVEGQEGPVSLLSDEEPDHGQQQDGDQWQALHDLAPSGPFVGRQQELLDVGYLLASSCGLDPQERGRYKLQPGVHHIALTGPAGIGKSALAVEAVRLNRHLFAGVIHLSLQEGKLFLDALIDIARHLHISTRGWQSDAINQCERILLQTMRSRASREWPYLLLLDGFEDVKEHAQVRLWHRFLCALPREVVVLVTSRSNPALVSNLEGAPCHWFDYTVDSMTDADMLQLFSVLASSNNLAQRIHLDDLQQQNVLREICELLDGYPLGAELIFGTAHFIDGKAFTPEAATRSLEEVRDELRQSPLAGILAVLSVAYQRLSVPARLLLSYLSAFKLPFSHQQIMMLVTPESFPLAQEALLAWTGSGSQMHDGNEAGATFPGPHAPENGPAHMPQIGNNVSPGPASAPRLLPAELISNWREARDELVETSFMQFDGRVYTIHAQIRQFAHSYLPLTERRLTHRVVAAYYRNLSHPSPEEWFAAFEHLEEAGEAGDLREAVRLAVRASWALIGRGYARALKGMLQRAEIHAQRLGDKAEEGECLCCLGAIQRQLGFYAEATASLQSSLLLLRAQSDQRKSGWPLFELAMLYREEGNFQQAGVYAEDALKLFHTTTDGAGEAWMQVVLGEVSRGQARYREALAHFERALAAFRGLHDDDGCATSLHNCGTVHEKLGEYTLALAEYEEALKLFNAQGERVGQSWVQVELGILNIDLGNLDYAEKMCKEATTIFREQNIRRGEAWALLALGSVERARHNANDARAYLEEAYAICSGLGDKVDLARVTIARGALCFDEKDYFTAKENYEQAHDIGKELGARDIEGRALRGRGDAACALDHFAEAEEYYQAALQIAEELETPAERRANAHHLGLLCLRQQRYTEALAYFVQALALDQRLHHPARLELQRDIDTLVAAQQLQDLYQQLRKT